MEVLGEEREVHYAPYTLENPFFQGWLRTALYQLCDQILADDEAFNGTLSLNSPLPDIEAFFYALKNHNPQIRKLGAGKAVKVQAELPETFDQFAKEQWGKFESSHYQDTTELAGQLLVLGPDAPIRIEDVRIGCREKVRQAAIRLFLSIQPDNMGELGRLEYQGKPIKTYNELQRLATGRGMAQNRVHIRNLGLTLLERPLAELRIELNQESPALGIAIAVLRQVIGTRLQRGEFGKQEHLQARLNRITIAGSDPSELSPEDEELLSGQESIPENHFARA